MKSLLPRSGIVGSWPTTERCKVGSVLCREGGCGDPSEGTCGGIMVGKGLLVGGRHQLLRNRVGQVQPRWN